MILKNTLQKLARAIYEDFFNEYPQSVLDQKLEKYVYICVPQFFYIKVWYEGCTFHGHVILKRNLGLQKGK